MTLSRRIPAITIGGFSLSASGVEVAGAPNLDDYAAAVAFAARAHDASGFWLADLLVYAETRPEWAEALDSILDHELLTADTIRNYRSVARRIRPAERVEGLSFGHHCEVAALDPADQRVMLERAKVEGWSTSQLRRAIRGVRQTRTGDESQAAYLRTRIADLAWLAEEACRRIPARQCAGAAEQIAAARKYLDRCEDITRTLREQEEAQS